MFSYSLFFFLLQFLVSTTNDGKMEFQGWVYFLPHDHSLAHGAAELLESAVDAAHDLRDKIKASKKGTYFAPSSLFFFFLIFPFFDPT